MKTPAGGHRRGRDHSLEGQSWRPPSSGSSRPVASENLNPFAGTQARLHHLPDAGWGVFVAARSEDAAPAAILRPCARFAVIVMQAGAAWPDAKGAALVEAMLSVGGTVVFEVPGLGDALAMQRRLAAAAGAPP